MADTILQNDSLRATWQQAFAAYQAAKDAAEAYERAVFDPAWKKVEAVVDRRGPYPVETVQALEHEAVPAWDEINEKMEALNERAYSELEWQVLLTPAPDREALEWKINLLFGDAAQEDGYCPTWRMDGVNAFLADVRRLLNH